MAPQGRDRPHVAGRHAPGGSRVAGATRRDLCRRGRPEAPADHVPPRDLRIVRGLSGRGAVSRNLGFAGVLIAALLAGVAELVALGRGHSNQWVLLEYVGLLIGFVVGAVTLQRRDSDFGILLAALAIVIPFA